MAADRLKPMTAISPSPVLVFNEIDSDESFQATQMAANLKRIAQDIQPAYYPLRGKWKARYQEMVKTYPTRLDAVMALGKAIYDYGEFLEKHNLLDSLSLSQNPSVGLMSLALGLNAKPRHEGLTRLVKYRAALDAVRGMGEYFDIHDESSFEDGLFMNHVTEMLPTDFVEKSNVKSPLHLVPTPQRSRAMYFGFKIFPTKMHQIPFEEIHCVRSGEKAPTATLRRKVVRRLDIEHERNTVYKWEYWAVQYYALSKTLPIPLTKDWEEVTGPQGQTFWRRPRRRKVAVQGDRRFVISVSLNHAVIAHELGHHMQALLPGITTIEREFLRRRAGIKPYDKSVAKHLKPIDGESYGEHEIGWTGDFIHPYMGKDYYPSYQTEVLSCGLEAIIGGSFGSLIGNNGFEPDFEMLYLILGFLGSAGIPETD